ncbi:MAG TPA: LysE family translocator [Pseudolabrys sp.]|jgi:threonine/homoserine/homoserine lactone efflux protein|nr:LysE family translocator [Pseudolabrys sp.]
MFGIHDIALFIVACVLLAITPGPDSTLVFAQSLKHGARGGLVASFGVMTGCLVHVTAASVGLSALLAASASAFNVVKWAGAAYLAFIGLRTIITAGRAAAATQEAQALRTSSVFWTGFLTNVLNPKVAVFFVAFLPQFVSPHAAYAPLGFAALGVLVIAIGFVWLIGLAFLAGRSAAMLDSRGRLKAWFERALGGAFIALAAKLAFAERP